MKIKGIKVNQGIKIKAVGLTEAERKLIENAMRRIKYGRKMENRPKIQYLIEFK